MARPTAADPSAAPRSLRARKIAALSSPPASSSDNVATRLRCTVDQRCLALGVVLTQDQRTLARIFDESDIPMTAGEVWGRARTLGLKASRSHVYVLVRRLLSLSVLIITQAGRTVRYAVPMSIRVTVRTQADQPQLEIIDPNTIETLVAYLMKSGRRVEGHDIEIDLVERPERS